MTYSASLINWNFKALLFLGLFFAVCVTSSAQQDTTKTKVETTRGDIIGEVEAVAPNEEAIEKVHSPRKAWILSAVLPGAGQVYNKKYWKVPILYGGFAVAGYFLKDNLEHIEEYKQGYIALTDDDSTTVNNTGYNLSQLDQLIDQYKTWRDWSYIALGAIYILNIIDANVDAHLFYFDVSEDISLNVSPYSQPFGRNASIGLAFTFKL